MKDWSRARGGNCANLIHAGSNPASVKFKNEVKTMTTWIVKKDQVDVNFTIQDLMKFSKIHSAKVVVEGFGILQNGGVVCLEN